MTNYRDMGTLNGSLAPQIPIDTLRYTQVYQATHTKAGLRLPFMNRSFISFSFGYDNNGKPRNIEDFNLIAYTDGDRLNRNAYGEFEDLTSLYDVIQGQFYWGTYYHTNTLSLDLATDGMTQRELDDFKYWFRAGAIRELILAEHPNRAIMARVSAQPALELLPFEMEVEMPIGSEGTIYTTKSTLYRGEIRLEFVMDEPFWYAKLNILGIQNVVEGYYEDSWVDANGVKVLVLNNPDALKIIYEDHIPLGSSTKVSAFLGGDIYAAIKFEDYSRIAELLSKDEDTARAAYELGIADAGADLLARSAYIRIPGEVETIPSENEGDEPQVIQHYLYYKGATIAYPDSSSGGELIGGKIAGASMQDQDILNGIEIPYGDLAYLYYGGNAPSPVKLTFTLTPHLETENITNNDLIYGSYMTIPKNKYTNEETPYNTITLTGVAEHKFKFTLPSFWLSYNQVLLIFDNPNIIRNGNAWLTVREIIRDTIRHPVIRAWANRVIDGFSSLDAANGSIITAHGEESTPIYYSKLRGQLKRCMSILLTNDTGTPFPATFVFNGKTGEALGTFTYRDVSTLDDLSYERASTESATLNEVIENIREQSKNSTITKVENVGDMVRSSYLLLDERNVLNDKFQILPWSELHPDYSYKIEHDIPTGLESVHFEFKNLYL